MNLNELVEGLHEYNVEIDGLYHLPTMLIGDPPDSDILSAIEDSEIDELVDVVAEIHEGESFAWLNRDGHIAPWLISALQATMTPSLTGKVPSCRVHGGFRRCGWFQGQTYEQALELAIAWARDYSEAQMQKSRDAIKAVQS